MLELDEENEAEADKWCRWIIEVGPSSELEDAQAMLAALTKDDAESRRLLPALMPSKDLVHSTTAALNMALLAEHVGRMVVRRARSLVPTATRGAKVSGCGL